MEKESQMLNKSFGLKLQELRKGQKIYKPEFAKYINVSLEDLDSFEKGDAFPPENVIANIIQILKIEPSELFAFNQYIEQLTNNQEYARSAVRKIESYQKNGIYPGERLILTFETEQNVLSQNIVAGLVEKYL